MPRFVLSGMLSVITMTGARQRSMSTAAATYLRGEEVQEIHGEATEVIPQEVIDENEDMAFDEDYSDYEEDEELDEETQRDLQNKKKKGNKKKKKGGTKKKKAGNKKGKKRTKKKTAAQKKKTGLDKNRFGEKCPERKSGKCDLDKNVPGNNEQKECCCFHDDVTSCNSILSHCSWRSTDTGTGSGECTGRKKRFLF